MGYNIIENGKVKALSKSEYEELEKKNHEYLNSGNFADLLKCKFIYSDKLIKDLNWEEK